MMMIGEFVFSSMLSQISFVHSLPLALTLIAVHAANPAIRQNIA